MMSTLARRRTISRRIESRSAINALLLAAASGRARAEMLSSAAVAAGNAAGAGDTAALGSGIVAAAPRSVTGAGEGKCGLGGPLRPDRVIARDDGRRATAGCRAIPPAEIDS